MVIVAIIWQSYDNCTSKTLLLSCNLIKTELYSKINITEFYKQEQTAKKYIFFYMLLYVLSVINKLLTGFWK